MNIDKKELVHLLTCCGEEEQNLFETSRSIRNATIGNGVYLRGLVEISNLCNKDCFYCGIRKSNRLPQRYTLEDEEVIQAAIFARDYNYGSIVLQGGERNDKAFVARIGKLLQEIKRLSQNRLGITLSLGEQSEDTYKYWFDCGAHRYLLRIETTDESLYRKIHPDDSRHTFRNRLECIARLQRTGYQTGTGVMIGLPFQSAENLADDLLFFKSADIDMVGMGPYLEHPDTPLYRYRDFLISQQERLRLALHMVSCLRLLVPDLNIAATTALQAIDPAGREKALEIGANVIMPNITPLTNRANYRLYDKKPGMDEGAEESTRKLIESVGKSRCEVKLGLWGDSHHWKHRTGKNTEN